MLQGGSSVPIHAVQGGGGVTDPSVSLLSGGEGANIVPVQGGGAVNEDELKKALRAAGTNGDINLENMKKAYTTFKLGGGAALASINDNFFDDNLKEQIIAAAAAGAPGAAAGEAPEAAAGAPEAAAGAPGAPAGEAPEAAAGAPEAAAAAAPQAQDQPQDQPRTKEEIMLNEAKRWSRKDDLTAANINNPRVKSPILLGGEIFMIRDPNKAPPDNNTIKENWEQKIFIPEEIDLLEKLGVTGPDMLDRIFINDNWGKRVADFFESLVKSECFVDTRFLSNSECRSSREFIRDLTQGLIKEITPETAMMYSDDTLGPIMEVEGQKAALETSLQSVQARLKAKLEEIRRQNESFHMAESALMREVQKIKGLAGFNPGETTAELEEKVQKNLLDDPSIEKESIKAVGNRLLNSEQAASVGRPPAAPATIYNDMSKAGRWLRQVNLIKLGGAQTHNGITATEWVGNIFIDDGGTDPKKASEKLGAKIVELRNEYVGWLIF
jgi:hypothetical protein